MVIDQVANKQCDHHNADGVTLAASPEAVSATSVTGVDMGNQANSPVDTTTPNQVVLVDALTSGLVMSSMNANNNSNSSVDASRNEDAPGDDNEDVAENTDAVAAEQAPVEEDQPAEEAAPVEAAPEESAPEGHRG